MPKLEKSMRGLNELPNLDDIDFIPSVKIEDITLPTQKIETQGGPVG